MKAKLRVIVDSLKTNKNWEHNFERDIDTYNVWFNLSKFAEKLDEALKNENKQIRNIVAEFGSFKVIMGGKRKSTNQFYPAKFYHNDNEIHVDDFVNLLNIVDENSNLNFDTCYKLLNDYFKKTNKNQIRLNDDISNDWNAWITGFSYYKNKLYINYYWQNSSTDGDNCIELNNKKDVYIGFVKHYDYYGHEFTGNYKFDNDMVLKAMRNSLIQIYGN